MSPNPSPKELFLNDNKAVTAHKNLVQSDVFQRSIETALLQMQRDLAASRVTDVGSAAAAHFCMVGAQQFVATLRTLADTSRPPATKDVDNLPGNVSRLS